MTPRGRWTRPEFLIGAILLLGLLLRAYHYFRNPSVWHDEAAMVNNVLALDFRQLLGPLHHSNPTAPLFLWLERAIVCLLGDSTFALRLSSLVASVMALALVAWVARREIGPIAALWATLLIASSDRLLWHACEAKPYSFDVLCACVLLAGLSLSRKWPVHMRVLAFLPLVPLVEWISYPGCFLCGGLLLALMPAVWRNRRPAALAAYATLVVVTVGAFAALYFGPIRAQRCSAMESCWTGQFPQWDRPWTVPIWSVASTLDVARYCFMPWGYPMALLAAVGGHRLWRSGQSEFVIAAAAPLGLNLLAAWLQGYPFGGARVVVHAAPALAILGGAGIVPCLDWIRDRSRAGAVATAAFLILPLGLTLYHVAVPWFRADAASAASYVLTHRTADEPVVSNHWEYEYYCRGISDQFHYFEPGFELPEGHVWLALTAFDPAERRQLVLDVTHGRHVLDRRDFTGTTVVLLDSAPVSTAAK